VGRDRLTRATDSRLVGGVAAGIARWLGIDPVITRIAFVVLAMSGGFGVVAYLVLWAVVPDERGTRALPHRVDVPGRSQRAAALGLIVVGGLLLLREAGLWVGDRLVWPVVLAAVGLALLWPGAFDTRPDLFATRRALVRVGAGVLAVGAGVAVFAAANADLDALRDASLAVLLTVAGLVLIFGPWWWRLGRALVEERRARIRSEERAEMAARVHDSVLQTLALIQQHAGDAAETARLARRQERDLRSWLYEADGAPAGTLKAAVRDAVAEVEDLLAVAVDAVVVGDCPVEPRVTALVHAAKEALVNAAKFAGVPSVSLYVEVETDTVTAFVRDRGVGFDPGAVADDRQGIARSIRERMERHGGSAAIRSQPGEGTEVELVVPRVDG